MSVFKQFFLSLLLSLFATVLFAGESGYKEIQQAGSDWAQAIASRNPEKITALYDKNALLYATFSNLIDTQAGILEYFKNLTKKKDLKVTFTKQTIRLFNDAAINSGLYVFSFTENGKTVEVPGRYTFVYAETKSGWKIIDHHSSVSPETAN